MMQPKFKIGQKVYYIDRIDNCVLMASQANVSDIIVFGYSVDVGYEYELRSDDGSLVYSRIPENSLFATDREVNIELLRLLDAQVEYLQQARSRIQKRIYNSDGRDEEQK